VNTADSIVVSGHTSDAGVVTTVLSGYFPTADSTPASVEMEW